MNHLARIWLVSVFLLSGPTAFANDFMFSEAAATFVVPLLLAWIVIGIPLGLIRHDFYMCGAGALVCLAVGIMGDGHLEVVLWIWMFYLGILVVYLAFNRNLDRGMRRANLWFHGLFLVLVVVCGGTARVLLWNKMGGFSAWVEHLRANLRWFAWITVILAGFVLMYFVSAVRPKLEQHETAEPQRAKKR